MDTIKCGRITYNLVDGDTILDNGACLQLVTRNVRNGWHTHSPRVSKAAFKEFSKLTNVSITTKGNLTYYRYCKNT